MLRGFLHRTASRVAALTATRRFDAAAGGRRWSANPTMGPLNVEVLAAAPAIRRRAAYFCRNNPWMANGVEAWVSNLVGSGIRPVSKHPDPAVRKTIQDAFARWTCQADADGTLDFYGLQAVAVRQMVEAGEVFGHMLTPDAAPGVPLTIRLVDAELVDVARTFDLGGGAMVVGGVEFDATGRRVAYYLSQRRPTDVFATTLPAIRTPAADIAHLFNPLAPGQVRGVSWTASVLLRLQELDELEDAQLMRQKIAAMFAAFVTDPNADPAVNPFDQETGTFPTLEPGTTQMLPPGMDVKFATPADAGAGVPFIKSQLRAIAAGMGIPDFLMTGDLSEANYSSLRSGLVQFRRRVEALQYGIIIHQFCRPVWERFVTLAVLSGTIDAPDFEANAADYLAAEWYPPAQQWVDPLKDQEAEALAVASGFKSRRQVVAAQGYDVEQLDAEIASDKAREAAMGLQFTVPPGDKKATINVAS